MFQWTLEFLTNIKWFLSMNWKGVRIKFSIWRTYLKCLIAFWFIYKVMSRLFKLRRYFQVQLGWFNSSSLGRGFLYFSNLQSLLEINKKHLWKLSDDFKLPFEDLDKMYIPNCTTIPPFSTDRMLTHRMNLLSYKFTLKQINCF